MLTYATLEDCELYCDGWADGFCLTDDVGSDGQVALEKIHKVLQGWPRVRIISQTPRYLHAEFTSTLFRFVDDVEFVVIPNEGVVHFRSCSRVGYSDLGANRHRMESLRKKLSDL